MKLAVAFLAGLLCSTLAFLVAGQAPGEIGRYQIAAGGEGAQGTVFQVDTYTGRLYARDWYWGKVHDLGQLSKPLAMPSATKVVPKQE